MRHREALSFEYLQIFTLLWIFVGLSADYLHDNYPASVIEDATLTTPSLLRKYNYPAETHYVTTEDQYILCMHRIRNPNGRPIFLMHGILDSSSTWIFMGPWSGLGYYLFENGYDVWMGNARGNLYSRNHTTLDPNKHESFWKFTWHEIGFYDLPAMIDYVLKYTNHQKLSYIGHSQGTTTFFVMSSTRPALQQKINSMHAIAPVAFMKHLKVPLLFVGRSFLGVLNVNEFIPMNDLLLNLICFQSPSSLNVCTEVLYQIVGREEREVNTTMWPVLFGHLPAGAAMRQLKHYVQLIDSDRFCMFDLGPQQNKKFYGHIIPPDYPVENINIPIGLYYTSNDYLASEVDVRRLASLLPNVVENNLLPYKTWNHVTMLWATKARKLLHRRMLRIIRRFEY